MTIKITIKTKLAVAENGDSAALVYHSSNKTDLGSKAASADGNAYDFIKTTTVTVSNGKYLLIFNQHNALSYYTVQITGYKD